MRASQRSIQQREERNQQTIASRITNEHEVKIYWAPGWDAARVLAQPYWGFKGTSQYIKTLTLGQVVKRGSLGPVKACSHTAVHVAIDPNHEFVLYYRGRWMDRRRNRRRNFYLAVMDKRAQVFEHGHEIRSAKWIGTKYTIVARVRRVSGPQPTRIWFERYLRSLLP